MAKFKGEIVVDNERCKGCLVCVDACALDVIGVSPNVNGKGYNYVQMQNDKCIGCANCAIVCPDGVITVYKVKVD